MLNRNMKDIKKDTCQTSRVENYNIKDKTYTQWDQLDI